MSKLTKEIISPKVTADTKPSSLLKDIFVVAVLMGVGMSLVMTVLATATGMLYR
jgi:hypothetical protein